MPTLQELRDQRAVAWTTAQDYNERSTAADGVDMTAEEEGAWQRALDDIDQLGEQIANRERTEQLDKRFGEIDDNTDVIDRGGNAGGSVDEYRAAFDGYVRGGIASLDTGKRELLEANFRAQSVGTDTAGGYTVPEGFWAKVTETMKFFGGAFGAVEMLTTDSGNTIPWPTNDDTANEGSILGENIAASEQDVVFGTKNLGAYMYSSDMVKVSLQLLQDSGVDIEAFISRKLGERLGRIENRHATIGTGSSQPQGFMVGATVGVTAAGATAITHDEVIDLEHSVDVAYRGNGQFQFHDLTFGYLRKLKDADGRPLWAPSVAAGAPSTFDGFGYTVNNHVATIATGARTIGFGDFRSAYVWRRVNGGSMMRLAERYAESLQVAFLGYERADGVVQDASAVKVLVQG